MFINLNDVGEAVTQTPNKYDECVEVTPTADQLNQTQSACYTNLNTTTFKNNQKIVHISVDKSLIERLSEDADDIKSAEQNDSDVVPGVYEGGAKVWECTHDLGDYLTALNDNGWAIIGEFVDKTVLDLGCGAGLLGILALKFGASMVHFQDYVSLMGRPFYSRSPICSFRHHFMLSFSECSCVTAHYNPEYYPGDWG